MNTSPAFNFVQNVFALNMFSNLVSDKSAPVQELQNDLGIMLEALFSNTELQKFIGTWEVVWGPVVGSYGDDAKNKVASNALYVAKNQDGQYVIATAATNPISLYGWFVEDFDVRTMVVWNDGAPAPDAPRISSGTHTGLEHLKQMKYADTTIIEFLKNTFAGTDQQVQLVVTGHSLGGALSPALALFINEGLDSWNPGNNVVVSVLPSAGASPGNQAFSDYQNKIMGARTLRFWNKLDPVPHGWEPDMLEMAPFLYYPYLKPGALLKGIISLVVLQSLEGTKPYPDGGYYTQLQPQAPPLPGQVNVTLTRNPSGAQVLQFFVDLGISEILKKLGVKPLAITIIEDVINVFLKEFAGEETIDVLLQELRTRLEKFLGKDSLLERLFPVFELLFAELQNTMVFLMQLGYQHVTIYADLMGTAPMHPLTQSIINGLVLKGKLSSDYKNVVDRLNDPRRTPLLAAPRIGKMVLNMLTDEFIDANGLRVG